MQHLGALGRRINPGYDIQPNVGAAVGSMFRSFLVFIFSLLISRERNNMNPHLLSLG